MAIAHKRLGRVATTVARHVARADADHVGRDVQRLQRLHNAHWPHQVDLDRAVERTVERHRRCRVNHDVAAGKDCAVDIVEPKSVGADVATNGDDAAGDHLIEGFGSACVLGLQAVEGVVLEDLAAHALGRVVAPAGAHEQHEGAVGHAVQQAFDQGGAHEPGTSGDGDPLVRELFGNHSGAFLAGLSTKW